MFAIFSIFIIAAMDLARKNHIRAVYERLLCLIYSSWLPLYCPLLLFIVSPQSSKIVSIQHNKIIKSRQFNYQS